MILTDREIQTGLETGQIQITPRPRTEAFSSTAVDLTLGQSIRLWKPAAATGVRQVVSPAAPGYKVNEVIKGLTELRTLDSAGFALEPGAFILAWTSETVSIPHQSRLAARVEGKSSLARLGLGVHVTAPTIHSGFQGPIQLEVFNHGTISVLLTPGLLICQLIFELTLGTPSAGYRGQFFGQRPT